MRIDEFSITHIMFQGGGTPVYNRTGTRVSTLKHTPRFHEWRQSKQIVLMRAIINLSLASVVNTKYDDCMFST